MIGLHASALVRLAAGAAFCVCAIALVWWVERAPPSAPAAAAVAPPAMRHHRLVVDSTYAVATWRVSVLGIEQSGAASAWGWHGVVAAPPGEDVVVQAFAAPGDAAPHRGLRLRLGDLPERLVWGAGDVVAVETAP